MKVWVVTRTASGYYGRTKIMKIFDSKEKASEFLDKNSDDAFYSADWDYEDYEVE